MSIGARLKEERIRLGQSQADFAALAGASRGGQLKWETGEAYPNAKALVAFADAGADVVYILFGQRQNAPLSDAGSRAEAKLDELEDQLINPGKHLADDVLSQGAIDYVRERARRQIEEIATSTSPDIKESTRARADEILRIHCNDEAAGQRRSARFASLIASQKRVEHDLQDLLNGVGITISSALHHRLLALMTDYRIDPQDMLILLQGLRSELGRADLFPAERA